MSLQVIGARGVSSADLLSAQEAEVNRDWGLAAAPHLPGVRMWAASHYSSISFCQASTSVLRYVT